MTSTQTQTQSQTSLPVVLLVFANDRYGTGDTYLRNLVKERKQITEAFWRLDGETVRLVVEPNVTAEALFDLLDAHNDDLVGLHFAGHASGHWLQLEDDDGRPEAINRDGLARRLGRLPSLRWIFLNGCATRPHVAAIQAACVAPVIATERAIRDDVAVNLARRFYRGLCQGVSLRVAFDRAVDAVRARDDDADAVRRPEDGPTRMGRRAGHKGPAAADVWPWTFHVHPHVEKRADWALPVSSKRVSGRGLKQLALAAGVVVVGLAAALLRPKPESHAPLAVEDVRSDGMGLTARVLGVDPEEPVDAHLQVACTSGEPTRIDLVPGASDNPARRRYEPIVGVHRMIMPPSSCTGTLRIAARDETAEAELPQAQSAPKRRVLVFRPAGEGEAFERFLEPFVTAARVVGRVVYSAVEGDVPVFTLPAPEGRTLDRETAAKLAEVGRLVQLVWPESGHGDRVAGEVFMPAGHPGSKPDATGRRGDPLFRVEHLSADPELSFDVTNELHALLMLVALADDARTDRLDVQIRYLSEAYEHTGSLLEAVGELDPDGLSRRDRRVAARLEGEVTTIREGLEARLARLNAGDER